jgi:hypothetical protein
VESPQPDEGSARTCNEQTDLRRNDESHAHPSLKVRTGEAMTKLLNLKLIFEIAIDF